MKINRINLGELICKLVREKGMSDAEFARRIGIQRQNVKKTVFEKHSLDTDLLCTISEVLDCNLFNYYKCNTDDYKELRATISIELGEEKQDKVVTFHFGKNKIKLVEK